MKVMPTLGCYNAANSSDAQVVQYTSDVIIIDIAGV